MSNSQSYSRYSLAEDGLRLHYLDIASHKRSDRWPVVCLPGLARTSDDFFPLALALAEHSLTPRRVLAFDYRGRGLSERDPDWRRYNIEVERADFLAILDQLSISEAHFIGTSRGGLHVLALTEVRPRIIKAAVLNDIGPVLEPAGLSRIKEYLGKENAPKTMDAAIASLKESRGRHFDGLSPAEWHHFAKTTFDRDETSLGLRYDPALAHTLEAFDLDKPLPDSWDLFDNLAGKPVLTVRGGNSDLLSMATLTAMESRWPESQAITVNGHGHAPLLMDDSTISQIDRFLAEADATEIRSGDVY